LTIDLKHNKIIKLFLKILQILILSTFVLTSYSQNKVNESPNSVPITDKKDTLKPPVVNNNDSDIDAPINYNARDSVVFDNDTKMMYLHGEAKIIYKDIELTSEYIEMDLEKSTVYAIGVKDSASGKIIGSPIFKEGTETFKSENMKYNFKTKRGLINGVISEQSGGFLHSEITKKQEDETIHIKGGKYTTCNLDHPHFYIGLTKAKVIPDDKIVSGPAYFVIEDVVMPIGIPFGFFPNKPGHASGIIIPQYGEEQNRGFYLTNGGYYFALSDYFDLQLTADIYSRGSWGSNVSSNYKKRYAFSGNIEFDYQNVVAGLKESTKYFKSYTYWIKWNHKQDTKARPYSNFSASVNIGKSDYYKFSTYTSPSQYLSNTRQSSVSYTKSFPSLPFNFSANLRHSQNNIDSTLNLSVPEISLNMNRIFPFKRKNKVGNEKIWEKFGFSINTNMKNTTIAGFKESDLFESNLSDKFDNGMKVSVPASLNTKFLKYLTLNLSGTFNDRLYLRSTEQKLDTTTLKVVKYTEDGFKSVYDFMYSASLNTKIYGMFTFKSQNLKAIRHVITPNVSFSYRPDYGQSKYDYYREYINANGDAVTYSRYVNSMYGNASNGRYGSVNFSLGNNLEMKVRNLNDTITGTKKVAIFEMLNFSTSYNIAADSLNWSALNVTGSTTLFKSLRMSYNAVVDPYAVDSIGSKINRFVWQDSSKIGRITSANLTLSYRLNSKSKSKTKKDKEKTDQLIGYPDNYVDFDIPWNISFDFSFRYSNSFRTPVVTQTIGLSGDLNLTPKWKISVTTGYSIKEKDITYTTLNIHRDLHCWEMRFTWVPTGYMKSINFQLNAKSSILQDLKLNKRSNYQDAYFDNLFKN
jgi:hypothetical protein